MNNEKIDISISRLLMAAIQTANELKINLSYYTSKDLDNKKIMMSYDDEYKEFILTLQEEIQEEIQDDITR